MGSLETTQEIHRWLHNKKVLVIGGGDTIEFNESSFDVVARPNQHFIRQGGRCDILMHNCCTGAEPDDCVDAIVKGSFKPKVFIGNTNRTLVFADMKKRLSEAGLMVDGFSFEYEADVPEDENQHWYHHSMIRMYDFKPFTGINLINYLKAAPVKSICVTGMDVHVNERTSDDWVGPHRISAQALCMRHLAAFDERIIYDETLSKTLKCFSGNKYNPNTDTGI